MGALKIPVVYDEKSVLIADDEPEHLDWLVDFLEHQGLKVNVVTNVQQAMLECQKAWYRIYIIDLNIPLGDWPVPTKAMYESYPGLSIIQAIRSQGSDGRRVIAYSAHANEQIDAEIKRLYSDYVAKGRPVQLKDKVREVLAEPDQTSLSLTRAASKKPVPKTARPVRKSSVPKGTGKTSKTAVAKGRKKD